MKSGAADERGQKREEREKEEKRKILQLCSSFVVFFHRFAAPLPSFPWRTKACETRLKTDGKRREAAQRKGGKSEEQGEDKEHCKGLVTRSFAPFAFFSLSLYSAGSEAQIDAFV